MASYFRLLLITIMVIFGAMLLTTIVAASFTWKFDQPTAEYLRKQPDWEFTYPFGPAKLTRRNISNNAAAPDIQSYITIKNVNPKGSENDKRYVLSPTKEKVFMEEDQVDQVTLPISDKQYFVLKWLLVLLVVMVVAVGVWITLLIYKFAGAHKTNNFFTTTNMRRLKKAGKILFSFGIIFYICSWYLPQIIRWTLGYTHIDHRVNLLEGMIPTYALVGLLLLVVAKAFEQGIEMKELQRYTI